MDTLKTRADLALNTLPTLPRLPRSRKTKAAQPCSCGCAAPTRGGRFLPGHDAILLAWTLRVERQLVSEAPTPHTDAVAANVAKRAGLVAPPTKAEVAAAKKAAKAAAKAAKVETETAHIDAANA